MERFGVREILGRETLFSYEVRRLMLAEKIVLSFDARARAMNWAEWTESNPQAADLLSLAERLAGVMADE